VWRLDLAGAGHQAISDIALYAELAEHVPDLPQLVRDYLISTAAGSVGPHARPWRTVAAAQVEATWAFLSIVLGIDPDDGAAAADRLEGTPGLTLRRR
jgi:hypothetical protein